MSCGRFHWEWRWTVLVVDPLRVKPKLLGFLLKTCVKILIDELVLSVQSVRMNGTGEPIS